MSISICAARKCPRRSITGVQDLFLSRAYPTPLLFPQPRPSSWFPLWGLAHPFRANKASPNILSRPLLPRSTRRNLILCPVDLLNPTSQSHLIFFRLVCFSAELDTFPRSLFGHRLFPPPFWIVASPSSGRPSSPSSVLPTDVFSVDVIISSASIGDFCSFAAIIFSILNYILPGWVGGGGVGGGPRSFLPFVPASTIMTTSGILNNGEYLNNVRTPPNNFELISSRRI